jgi:hypothetical protein
VGATLRRLLVVGALAGCGIDESGLLAAQDGAVNDVALPDVVANDVVTSDVTDAGVDVTQQDAPIDVATDAPIDVGVDAGILTITGGTYTLVDEDAGVCSQNANNAASFQLVNDRAAPVDLVWVDYQCAEQPYGTILANAQKNQGTYVTHVWRVRNDADKAFLAGFVLNSANAFTVTVH